LLLTWNIKKKERISLMEYENNYFLASSNLVFLAKVFNVPLPQCIDGIKAEVRLYALDAFRNIIEGITSSKRVTVTGAD